MTAPDRLLDVSMVARRFNVTDETVRAWIRGGKLAAILTPTGRYRIPLSALLAFQSKKAQDSQTP